MAESYGVPGKVCDVGTIEQSRTPWEDFCDCMFLEPQESLEYWCDGKKLPVQFLPMMKPEQLRAMAEGFARQPQYRGQPVELRVTQRLVRTENWFKCMRQWCASPTGCATSKYPDYVVPFDVSPGLLAAPWTDVGAATRLIPKRNAGFMYDVAGLTTFDFREYQPLALWRTFFLNPTKFGLLMAKASLIPGLTPELLGICISILTVGGGMPWLLLPAVIDECKRKGLDIDKEVWLPVQKFGVNVFEMAKTYFTECGVGINFSCGAGIVVQQAAKDQIETGEVNRLQTPILRTVCYYMAENGAATVNLLGKVAEGFSELFSGKVSGLRGVMYAIHDGFVRCAELPASVLKDEGLRKLFRVLAKVFEVVAVIVDGIERKLTVWEIADDLCLALLGFRPSDFKRLVDGGNDDAALQLANAGTARTGNTLDTIKEMVDLVKDAIDGIVDFIEMVNRDVGGGLDALASFFRGLGQYVDPARQAIDQTVQQTGTSAAVSQRRLDTVRLTIDVDKVKPIDANKAGQGYKPPSQYRPPSRRDAPAASSSSNVAPLLLGAAALYVVTR